jgi:Tfp pilus assembly protein PilF
MRHEFQKIRCQRCRAANPFGQELCDQCGTRLMLIVEPTTLRFEEDSEAESPHPAVLLERLTLLENGLMKFAEKMERGFDLMLKQAENIHREHLLVEALVALLVRSGVLTRDDLKELSRAAFKQDETARRDAERRQSMRACALAEPHEGNREAFVKAVYEGFELLASGDETPALKALERATLNANGNYTLEALLGELFFKQGKDALANTYLSRAADLKPPVPGVYLMLGILIADEGQLIKVARFHILEGLKHGGDCFAGRYALGRIYALEGNWGAARAEFQLALKARACAESQFLVALSCLKLARLRLAARHVQQSLALDENYADAYTLLGLVRQREGDAARAREAFERAALLRGKRGSQQSDEENAREPSEAALLHSVFGGARLKGKSLLTSGDKRLARLLREDALEFAATAR